MQAEDNCLAHLSVVSAPTSSQYGHFMHTNVSKCFIPSRHFKRAVAIPGPLSPVFGKQEHAHLVNAQQL